MEVVRIIVSLLIAIYQKAMNTANDTVCKTNISINKGKQISVTKILYFFELLFENIMHTVNARAGQTQDLFFVCYLSYQITK